MSFITPKEYKEISDKLGLAFAQVRDAIRDNSTNNDAYWKFQEALAIVATSTDNVTNVSETIDPVGSKMKDLGNTWFSAANTQITETSAARTASSLFSSALTSLNNHVKNRTLMPNTSPSRVHRNISEWYDTYAHIYTNGDYSLFSDGAEVVPSTPTYFSEEFVDLCTAVGITIPTKYRA